MTEGTAEERADVLPMALDPFAYFQEAASKIRGLGGGKERPELAYGFHTDYVCCAPGYRSILVKFDDLRATHGLIHLRVHMLSTRPGAQARVATVERSYLSELAAQGGEAIVRFEALPNTLYAMFGQVLDTTDATASGLSVILDRPASAEDENAPEFEPTMFGDGATRGAMLLTSNEEPSLAAPVSQVMNLAQIREPAFARWRKHLVAGEEPEFAWQQIFVLQALDRYGLLDRGADGLGYSALESAVAAILARRQCVVTLATDHDQEDVGQQNQEALLKRIPSVADADIGYLLPSLHVISRDQAAALKTPFDFTWSLNILGVAPDFSSAMNFMSSAMTRLRPGGVGVHVTRIAIDEVSATAGYLTRSHIERLALNLISQGHSVAQTRFQLGDQPRDRGAKDGALVPFGLIVQRG